MNLYRWVWPASSVAMIFFKIIFIIRTRSSILFELKRPASQPRQERFIKHSSNQSLIYDRADSKKFVFNKVCTVCILYYLEYIAVLKRVRKEIAGTGIPCKLCIFRESPIHVEFIRMCLAKIKLIAAINKQMDFRRILHFIPNLM